MTSTLDDIALPPLPEGTKPFLLERVETLHRLLNDDRPVRVCTHLGLALAADSQHDERFPVLCSDHQDILRCVDCHELHLKSRAHDPEQFGYYCDVCRRNLGRIPVEERVAFEGLPVYDGDNPESLDYYAGPWTGTLIFTPLLVTCFGCAEHVETNSVLQEARRAAGIPPE